MKKLILIISILCISNCHKKASETDLLNKANPEGKYGTEISIMENEEISTLLNEPNKYIPFFLSLRLTLWLQIVLFSFGQTKSGIDNSFVSLAEMWHPINKYNLSLSFKIQNTPPGA